MKNLKWMPWLGLSVSMMALPAAYAAPARLHCEARPAQYDVGNWASFDLVISSRSARVTDARLSDRAIADIRHGIENGEHIATPESLRYVKDQRSYLEAAGRGLALSGSPVAYLRPPKTPRTRYLLQFQTKGFDVAQALDNMAPEAEKLMLFVPLQDGEPNYDELYLEYDGTQGPYYDHFDCR